MGLFGRRNETGEKMTWGSSVSICFLVFVNIIVAIGGLALIGAGAYLFKNFSTFDALVSKNSIMYILSSGIIVFIFSMIAISGALTNHKSFLFLYVVVLVIIVAGEVAVSVLALDYLGVIKAVGETSGVNGTGNNFDSSTERAINNFLLRAYQTCCVQNENFCDNLPSDEFYCKPVFTCDSPGAEFDEVCVDANNIVAVDLGICTALQGFTQKGSVIVGHASKGCGRGDPAQFLRDVTDFLTDKLRLAGYGVLGVGLLEFLLILFTMYLIFGKKVYWDRNFYGNEVVAFAVPEPIDMNNNSNNNVNHYTGSDNLYREDLGDGMTMTTTSRASRRIPNFGPDLDADVNNQNVAGNRRSQGYGSHVSAKTQSQNNGTRERANSATTQMSISKKKMEENPDVIDKVL